MQGLLELEPSARMHLSVFFRREFLCLAVDGRARTVAFASEQSRPRMTIDRAREPDHVARHD
jgi:hypothetical protein